jgi:hypothetical protein
MRKKGSTKATYASAKCLRTLEETHFQGARFPNRMSLEALTLEWSKSDFQAAIIVKSFSTDTTFSSDKGTITIEES